MLLKQLAPAVALAACALAALAPAAFGAARSVPLDHPALASTPKRGEATRPTSPIDQFSCARNCG